MFDFAAARRMMVDGQVRPNDVTDLRLIAAMLDVPRERFTPGPKANVAYLDFDLPVDDGRGRTARCLLKPMVLSKLIQAADITPDDRVLDVGCATGYSTAILARLAASVVALEQDSDLAAAAGRSLAAMGVRNASVVTGPLADGWSQGGPYDVILLNGASAVAPRKLLEQLKDGGRLVGVVGEGPVGKAMLYRSAHGTVSGRPVFDAVAPALPGFDAPAAFVF